MHLASAKKQLPPEFSQLAVSITRFSVPFQKLATEKRCHAIPHHRQQCFSYINVQFLHPAHMKQSGVKSRTRSENVRRGKENVVKQRTLSPYDHISRGDGGRRHAESSEGKDERSTGRERLKRQAGEAKPQHTEFSVK